MTDRCIGLPYQRNNRPLAAVFGDNSERVEYLLKVQRQGGMLMVAQAPIADANFRMVFQGNEMVHHEQLEAVPQ